MFELIRHRRKEVNLKKALKSIWCLSDGTPGMRHQTLAVATAMKWDQCANFRDIVISPHPALRYFPQLGQWLPQLPLTRETKTQLPPINTLNDYPQIIVTCGRRMAGISIALKARAKRLGASVINIHLQDPRLDPRFFDMLIVPEHDPVRGDNVIVTKGALNRLDRSHIKTSARKLPNSWQKAAQPRVVILIGGDNRRYKISGKMTTNMINLIANFARSNAATFFLVPAPRCPENVWHRLQTSLRNSNFHITKKKQLNPYPGVLGIADAIIVTSDSVNMVSEAASTGKPVMIAYWTTETGRIAKFHQSMQKAGHTMPLDSTLPTKPFLPLNETDRVSEEIQIRLQCRAKNLGYKT